MDACGTVFVRKDIMSFSLKCTYCEEDIKHWQDFIAHIQNSHGPDETWIDESLDTIADCKVNIFIDDIKLEVDECGSIEDNHHDKVDALTKDESCDMSINEEWALPADEHDKLESENDNEDDDENDDENNDSTYEPESSGGDDAIDSDSKFSASFQKRNNVTKGFIELYQSLPCLWDPKDENFRNFPARTEAHTKIINGMLEKFRVTITERVVKAGIKKIRQQYYDALQQSKDPDKSTKISNIVKEYFEKCSFLRIFDETPEDIITDIDGSKCLVFTNMNDVTLAFIDAYASFPALYDPKHIDYSTPTVRRQAYEEISNTLKAKANAIFTDTEVFKGIINLKQWYYKTLERSQQTDDINEAQQQYLKKCKFLPPKMAKKKFSCEICSKILLNEMTMHAHMYKEHNIGEMPYKCPNCDRSFEHRTSLTAHQRRQHIGKVHQCDYCERRFAILVDLHRHTQTHFGVKPFVCELCGKAFRSKTQLGYHSDAVHTKTRAFKCTMCPKDFLKKRDLTDHIKAHLNIRDKICETCGKGFTNCHSLIRHRQIHSEIKKFACKLCDAKFHQFVGLNSHMKRTHNIVKNKPKNE